MWLLHMEAVVEGQQNVLACLQPFKILHRGAKMHKILKGPGYIDVQDEHTASTEQRSRVLEMHIVVHGAGAHRWLQRAATQTDSPSSCSAHALHQTQQRFIRGESYKIQLFSGLLASQSMVYSLTLSCPASSSQPCSCHPSQHMAGGGSSHSAGSEWWKGYGGSRHRSSFLPSPHRNSLHHISKKRKKEKRVWD